MNKDLNPKNEQIREISKDEMKDTKGGFSIPKYGVRMKKINVVGKNTTLSIGGIAGCDDGEGGSCGEEEEVQARYF